MVEFTQYERALLEQATPAHRQNALDLLQMIKERINNVMDKRQIFEISAELQGDIYEAELDRRTRFRVIEIESALLSRRVKEILENE